MKCNRLKDADVKIDYKEEPEVNNWRPVSENDAPPGEANLVTSALPNDKHFCLIDIDLPMHVVQSSSGFSHLFIKKALTLEEYLRVLKVMSDVGIVQEGYYNAAKHRGYGCLRLPGLIKGTSDDQRFSFGTSEGD